MRNELLIVSFEDLTPTGVCASALSPSGRQAAERASISKSLQERALASFAIK